MSKECSNCLCFAILAVTVQEGHLGLESPSFETLAMFVG